MSHLTIDIENPPEDIKLNAERIAREGAADEVDLKPAVDDTIVIEASGRTNDMSREEFDMFVERIEEIIEPVHDSFDTFYGTGQFDKSYLIRLRY